MMFLSKQYGVPYVDLNRFDVDVNVVKLIPSDVAQKYQIMPINRTGATITIAMVDPSNVFAIDDVKFMTGYNVEPVVATEAGIKSSIAKYYSLTSAIEKVMTSLQEDDKSVGVIHEEEEKVDVAKLKAEVELDQFRASQAALPQPVDQHFAAAIEELKQIEERTKKTKPNRKQKGSDE